VEVVPNEETSYTENMIGVESGPGNTCQGDSGGPLLVRTEQADGTFVDTRIGITSFGLCNFEEAAGFTRTSSVVDWIRTTACVDLGSTADFCNTPSKAPTMAPTLVNPEEQAYNFV